MSYETQINERCFEQLLHHGEEMSKARWHKECKRRRGIAGRLSKPPGLQGCPCIVQCHVFFIDALVQGTKVIGSPANRKRVAVHQAFRAWARGDLPDTASVLVFIRDTIKQMEEGKLKRARQVMDWCPMLLKGMCVRYMCRSGCSVLPTRETDWWIVQTSTRKNHWHCPSCGQRYLYSATKEYHTRQSSQLLALDLLDGQTLLTPSCHWIRTRRPCSSFSRCGPTVPTWRSCCWTMLAT